MNRSKSPRAPRASNVRSSPIFSLEAVRPELLSSVTKRTLADLSENKAFADPARLELLLGEALYQERVRLKKEKGGLFTRKRLAADRALWGTVQGGLLTPVGVADRRVLLERIITHYGEEIGGHFDPRVYSFATQAVPWGLSFMFDSMSVRRWMPWGIAGNFEKKINLSGEISQLQALSKKGTVLLVPTHQSNLDSPLLGYIIYLMGLPPFSYGAGLNLFTNPVLNFFMSRLGAYTVDRKKTNPIYKLALKNYSTEILSRGIHSVFFPGGGRSRSGAIEKRLKLGLLGTALQAQIEALARGSERRIYVVPMVTSYHFVLEASSLIEDFLTEQGRSRYLMMDDESWQAKKVIEFFKKFFLSDSTVSVRIGKALDVFGNPVGPDGQSFGPNQTIVEPRRWLTSCGELKAQPQRDQEYTRLLGEAIVNRFHRDSVVLSSHAVAWAYFECLRRRYPDLDLYRFLRLSLEQRNVPWQSFLAMCREVFETLEQRVRREELHLSAEFKPDLPDSWIEDGIQSLGLLHDVAVVKRDQDVVYTEDMNLLYYYRNRLTGYATQTRESYDDKGFLV